MEPKNPEKTTFYCTVCKKVCTERGRWVFLENRTDPETEPAGFCLSLCPECSRKIYPKYYHVI